MKKRFTSNLLITLGLSFGLLIMGCTPQSQGGSSQESVKVTGVSLDKTSLYMLMGDTTQLIATVSPSDASNKDVTWTSSRKSVVTVSDSGLLTALSVGTSTITVKTEDGEYTATCEVTVSKGSVKVTGVYLNRTQLPLAIDQTYNLLATVEPYDADDTSVTWSSSDESIAAVNRDGKVTGVKEGTANVTVTTVDGGFTATCEVNVFDTTIAVTGVSLNQESYELEVGDSITLIESIEPYNATNQNVTWESSDSSVVSVTNGTITALKEGEVAITVTTVDGGFTASCVVSVSEKEVEPPYVPEESEDVLIITDEVEFTLEKDYKQIYVNAPDKVITINMNGHTVENSENSPIYVQDCDSIDISATKNTTSYIKDTRATYTEDVDDQGKGAIYVANGDLTLKGKGALEITANYYNGILGKDDVEVKNLTLKITAVKHGIKGNDSVEIQSGTIDITCGGDGLHSENSDLSSKGKQRGNITVSSGTLTINSWGDGIAAAYDAIVEEPDATKPTSISIKTNKFSSYDGEVLQPEEDKLYLKMNSSAYASGGYTYAALIDGTWYPETYKGTMENNGGQGGWWLASEDRPGPGPGPSGGTYYVYSIEKPTTATSFTLYRFVGSNVTTYSTTNYDAVSESKSFNSNYDTIEVTVSNNRITFGSWSVYSNKTNVADISAKGIKADNNVSITGGTIDIKCFDDAVHANNDVSLENGQIPTGDVIISGGTLTLWASDDAVHADGTLKVSGGQTTVTSSYEGFEGNVIVISGGTSYVTSTDDCVNAGSGKSTPNILISGGYIDVTVPTNGDTDGIDSNGTFTQTGGVCIIKGPGSASGGTSPSAALDTDSTVGLTGGTLIVFGGIEKTPSYSGVTRTLCTSSTVSAGSHKVSFTSGDSYTTTLTQSARGCLVFSVLGSASLN